METQKSAREAPRDHVDAPLSVFRIFDVTSRDPKNVDGSCRAILFTTPWLCELMERYHDAAQMDSTGESNVHGYSLIHIVI